jgi:hypothetical protein
MKGHTVMLNCLADAGAQRLPISQTSAKGERLPQCGGTRTLKHGAPRVEGDAGEIQRQENPCPGWARLCRVAVCVFRVFRRAICPTVRYTHVGYEQARQTAGALSQALERR